jgi:hypothetical protein
MAAPQGFGSHYASFSVPIRDLILNLKKLGPPRGWHWIPYDLSELRYLSDRFPPGEVVGHGVTCDPSEVVRLKILGKPHSEIARIMGLSSATIAAAFRRWYKKARELQASPSRFSNVEPSVHRDTD